MALAPEQEGRSTLHRCLQKRPLKTNDLRLAIPQKIATNGLAVTNFG